jgi:carboxypeptidase D
LTPGGGNRPTSNENIFSIDEVYNSLSNYARTLIGSSRESLLQSLTEPTGKFQYHNYESLVARLKELNQRYPAITSLYTIGKSVEKRDIWVMIISDQPLIHEAGEPEVRYIGNIHGNEVISRECLLQFIEYLCINYDTHDYITKLVNNVNDKSSFV